MIKRTGRFWEIGGGNLESQIYSAGSFYPVDRAGSGRWLGNRRDLDAGDVKRALVAGAGIQKRVM